MFLFFRHKFQDSESAAPGYFDQIHSGEDEDSACEDLEEEDPAASEASIVPEGVMQRLAPRTLNFVIRGFSGLTLLSSFVGLVAMGPSGLLLLVSCHENTELHASMVK